MAHYITNRNDIGIVEYLCNSIDDFNNINTKDIKPGSKAYCIKNKKRYILNKDHKWYPFREMNLYDKRTDTICYAWFDMEYLSLPNFESLLITTESYGKDYTTTLGEPVSIDRWLGKKYNADKDEYEWRESLMFALEDSPLYLSGTFTIPEEGLIFSIGIYNEYTDNYKILYKKTIHEKGILLTTEQLFEIYNNFDLDPEEGFYLNFNITYPPRKFDVENHTSSRVCFQIGDGQEIYINPNETINYETTYFENYNLTPIDLVEIITEKNGEEKIYYSAGKPVSQLYYADFALHLDSLNKDNFKIKKIILRNLDSNESLIKFHYNWYSQWDKKEISIYNGYPNESFTKTDVYISNGNPPTSAIVDITKPISFMCDDVYGYYPTIRGSYSLEGTNYDLALLHFDEIEKGSKEVWEDDEPAIWPGEYVEDTKWTFDEGEID